MLPRKSAGLLCALLFMIAASRPLCAQTMRYHFGDDPRWEDAAFDDSRWPVAKDNAWPRPVFDSDGFVWVRMHLPVRADSGGPLALLIGEAVFQRADEVFVNGVHVGGLGQVPPHAWLLTARSTVYRIPDGAETRSGDVVIALRIWYPAVARRGFILEGVSHSDSRNVKALDTGTIELGDARVLEDRQSLAQLRALVTKAPGIVLNLVIALAGFGVLLLWMRMRAGHLLLSGVVLVSYAFYILYFQLVEAQVVRLPYAWYGVLAVVLCVPSMAATAEFIWRFHGLGGMGWKRAAWAGPLAFNLGNLVVYLVWHPFPLLRWAAILLSAGLNWFNLVTFCANLWVVLVERRNRLIAGSMALIPLCSTISAIPGFQNWGLFDIASELATVCLTIALAIRAWQTWRTRDALEVEFEAAREVQERLVTPPGDVPGFAVESAYLPAAHVGGDFFFVRGEADGSMLAVVGDVSGKGLRAALTVSAVMGALRTMPALEPARILGDLNRGLAGQLGGGFVTCCALRIEPDGGAVIANAGHLPPYCHGVEVDVEPGLPLGIDPGLRYEETSFVVEPTDRLTLVSDGVVEAQSASGELFGFERTRAMSSAKADELAATARQFGQEDDITVLTIARVGKPVAQCEGMTVVPATA